MKVYKHIGQDKKIELDLTRHLNLRRQQLAEGINTDTRRQTECWPPKDNLGIFLEYRHYPKKKMSL